MSLFLIDFLVFLLFDVSVKTSSFSTLGPSSLIILCSLSRIFLVLASLGRGGVSKFNLISHFMYGFAFLSIEKGYFSSLSFLFSSISLMLNAVNVLLFLLQGFALGLTSGLHLLTSSESTSYSDEILLFTFSL